MTKSIPVVDLFSGPGGLGEGFSAFEGNAGQIFKVACSVEKERSAAETLRLRTFFREFEETPDEYYRALRGDLSFDELFKRFPCEFSSARNKVWQEELGENDFTQNELNQIISERIKNHRHWVLIGGPPCQAYSTVGRARNRGIKDYNPIDDKRHFLYREYLKVIEKNWPSVFVMENVPGMLSAKIDGEPMFTRIISDLEDPCAALDIDEHPEFDGYRIYSLVKPSAGYDLWHRPVIAAKDLIVKSEEYGIPQSRHRVILLGIRSDIATEPQLLSPKSKISTKDVIDDLPRLRSGLSKNDSDMRWLEVLKSSKKQSWWRELEGKEDDVLISMEKTISKLSAPRLRTGKSFIESSKSPNVLKDWYHDPKLGGVCNHEARSHMDSDLYRYLFASSLVKVVESKDSRKKVDVSGAIQSKLEHFPESLLPEHKNVQEASSIKKVHFANRFQVQRAKAPSSTIVSHIAKDGHYYIHYDPTQCRSLTVREAARLQTFPDNYFFCGNRTEQYTQVGNAVPPLLSRSIAQVVMNVLSDD